MPAPTSEFTIAKSTVGVLPISAVIKQTHVPVHISPREVSTRGPQSRLKVVVRRLPPGLTKSGFENALGEEWKLGNGKLNWIVYKPGKVSNE